MLLPCWAGERTSSSISSSDERPLRIARYENNLVSSPVASERPGKSPVPTLAKYTLFIAIFLAGDRVLSSFLAGGLERGYGMDEPADVLCIGHSHTALGIDGPGLSERLGLRVAKFALNGANAADRLTMIRHYIETQPSKVRLIVYDVDAHTFTGQGLSLNSYALFYPFMDTPSVRDYVRSVAPFSAYCMRRLIRLSRFDLNSCNASIRGWLRVDSNFKRGTLDLARLQKEIQRGDVRPISFDQECIDCVEQTLDFIASKGIRCVLLYIPTVDVFNQAEPEEYEKAIAMLRSYADRYDTVTFLDYNVLFAHRHELFYDPIHLNSEGRAVVTQQLAQDLGRMLGSASYARGAQVR
jgi:hypothetical protein